MRHSERLALAHLLCGLGDPGRITLHQILSCCPDYSPSITNQWFGRTNPGRKPISCHTLSKWLKDFLPSAVCPCGETKLHGSPLNLPRRQEEPAVAEREKQAAAAAGVREIAEWMQTEVRQEKAGS